MAGASTGGWPVGFSRRVQDEVLCITIHSHAALERLLKGFAPAYNARRQRVLKGASPNQAVRDHLAAKPELANPRFRPPDPCLRTKDRIAALRAVADAKEVSHPDTGTPVRDYQERAASAGRAGRRRRAPG